MSSSAVETETDASVLQLETTLTLQLISLLIHNFH